MPADPEVYVGKRIERGFCQGYFGRDFYGPGTIVAVGHDWAVVMDDHGYVLCGQRKGETPAESIGEASLDGTWGLDPNDA